MLHEYFITNSLSVGIIHLVPVILERVVVPVHVSVLVGVVSGHLTPVRVVIRIGIILLVIKIGSSLGIHRRNGVHGVWEMTSTAAIWVLLARIPLSVHPSHVWIILSPSRP